MHDNASQSYSSSSASRANLRSTSINVRSFVGFAWRILIIAADYTLTSLIAIPLLSRSFEVGGLGVSVLSGILIGATLAPIAARMQISRFRQWVVWGSVLFLNNLSLGIEGAFFAPTVSPMRGVPITWTACLLFQSLATAALIAWLCGQNASPSSSNPPRERAWHSWVWRFVVSSFSYLLFYFTFGAVDYALSRGPMMQRTSAG